MDNRKLNEPQEAMELFNKEYEKAAKAKWVRNPVAYALYQTWKHFDRRKSKMAKREYDESDTICGNCFHHKPSWETGHLAGWHCDNYQSDAYGCSTEYDDGEECPDFESKR